MGQPDIGGLPRLPKMGPLQDPALVQQQQFSEYQKNIDSLTSEAHAYTLGQQHAAEDIQNQWQQAQQAPSPNPVPRGALLPYLANAFAGGFSGNDQLTQSGERAVNLNRAQLEHRRGEVLQNLHERYLAAARQADQAGDLEAGLKYQTKAAAYLDQYKTVTENANRSVATREAQTFAREEQERAQRFQASQAAMGRAQELYIARMREDPVMAARIQGETEAYQAQARVLGGRTDPKGMEAFAKATKEFHDLMDRHAKEAQSRMGPAPGEKVVAAPAAPFPTKDQFVSALVTKGLTDPTAVASYLASPGDDPGLTKAQEMLKNGVNPDDVRTAVAMRVGAGPQLMAAHAPVPAAESLKRVLGEVAAPGRSRGGGASWASEPQKLSRGRGGGASWAPEPQPAKTTVPAPPQKLSPGSTLISPTSPAEYKRIRSGRTLSEAVQRVAASYGINDSTKVNRAMVTEGGGGGDYYDSAKGVVITFKRAMQELEKHGMTRAGKADFLREMGTRVTYSAQKVLDWLGY